MIKFQFIIFLSLIWHVCRATPDEGRVPSPDQPGDREKNPLARGWGDNIDWIDLESGIELAKKERKPLMLLIHKTWCGACQSLKTKFAKAKMIAELAKNFVMVNAEDDEEPWEEEYYPDNGKYIPRILFLSPDGDVLKDVINPKDEYKQYPYYYSNPAPIIHAMQNVLKKHPSDGKAKNMESEKEKAKELKEKEKKEKEAKMDEKELKKEEKAIKEETSKNEKEEKKELPRKGKSEKKPVSEEEEEESHEDDDAQPPSKKPPKKEL